MKRKKKGIKIAAALLTAALIVMLLCVVGCQGRGGAADPGETTGEPTSEATEAPTEHVHMYSEEIVDPGCTERGYTLFVCACGEDSYKDKFVDALGHDWSEWTTVEEATEEKAGMEERKCARCGETETRDIPKVIPGHEHEYVESVAVPATCTEPGVMAYICECGGSFTNPIDPLKHDYSEKKVAPTCGEKGYTRHTCVRCGEFYDDTYTNATGQHKWKLIGETAGTCKVKGHKDYICTVCSATKSDPTSYGDHSWGAWETVKDPTETSTGIKERICSVCKGKDTEVIDKLDPQPTQPKPTEPKPTEPKPTEPPVTEPPHKHVYKWVVTKAPTCTTKGIESYICDCGEVKETRSIDATGHTWVLTSSEAGTCCEVGSETYDCSVCPATEVRKTTLGDHNWVHHHVDEVGHWEDKAVCHCGWSCTESQAKAAGYDIGKYMYVFHVKQFEGTDEEFDHSYYNSANWVIDTPAVDYDECTVCGATK